MVLTRLVRRLEAAEQLDPIVDALVDAADRILPPGGIKDALHGRQLGHALHPMLVAAPIGLSVGATLLDLFGDERDRPAARRLLGTALLTVAPTAASGVADWSSLGARRRPKRVGLVHASANVGATLAYLGSWLARRRGHHGVGTTLALVGGASLVVGGYLGGHLAYVEGIGVNRNLDHEPSPGDWTDAGAAGGLDGGPMRAEVEGQAVVIARRPTGEVAAMGATCSHLAGALDEGELDGDCIVCLLHGSMFRLADGSVAAGPATVDQPPYDARVVEGRVQVRARAA